jgi:hypothetical protein
MEYERTLRKRSDIRVHIISLPEAEAWTVWPSMIPSRSGF